MWWGPAERQCVFVDLVVTQQGLRPELKVGELKGAKERGVAGMFGAALKWLLAPHISHRGVLQR